MEKDTQYKINYYFDEEDGFYHIEVYGVETGKRCACLYAKDRGVLNRDIEAFKGVYNIISIEGENLG